MEIQFKKNNFSNGQQTLRKFLDKQKDIKENQKGKW